LKIFIELKKIFIIYRMKVPSCYKIYGTYTQPLSDLKPLYCSNNRNETHYDFQLVFPHNSNWKISLFTSFKSIDLKSTNSLLTFTLSFFAQDIVTGETIGELVACSNIKDKCCIFSNKNSSMCFQVSKKTGNFKSIQKIIVVNDENGLRNVYFY